MSKVFSNGTLLIDDVGLHRLALLDQSLKVLRIVADVDSGRSGNFASMGGGILPFVGDSVALIDFSARALIIMDREGRVLRTIAASGVADLVSLRGDGFGGPGFDAGGRLYYRSHASAPQRLRTAAGADTSYATVDSAPILRIDWDGMLVDTIAAMKIPRVKTKTVRNAISSASYALMDPLPVTDAWAYLADGTVAIVRGADYHVDWISPEGVHRSSPPMPFDWRRVTDDEKARLVDSVNRRLDSLLLAAEKRAGGRGGRGGSDGAFATITGRPEVLPASELPDYYPPIQPGFQMSVDGVGNLWILPRTSASAHGGLLYDVVDRTGRIVERVQLPPGRRLMGFGPGGEVLLAVPRSRSGEIGFPRLERAKVLRPRGL